MKPKNCFDIRPFIPFITNHFTMKNLLFILAFFFAANLFGQHDQPKLRMSSGFLSSKYELGDKDVSDEEVSLQLEKTCPAAFYDWKRANALSTQSTVWSVVSCAGLLTTLFAKKDNVVIGGAVVCLVGSGFAIGTILGESSKRDKAITAYNRQFGY